MMMSNPLTTRHDFSPAEKDHHVCRICGLSRYGVTHPVVVNELMDDFATAGLNQIEVGGQQATGQEATQQAWKGSAHYKSTTLEPIEVIAAWKLDFLLGNVVKYVFRATQESNGGAVIEMNLVKAIHCLQMKLEQLKTGKVKETIR